MKYVTISQTVEKIRNFTNTAEKLKRPKKLTVSSLLDAGPVCKILQSIRYL